jgi:hypothetical protein
LKSPLTDSTRVEAIAHTSNYTPDDQMSNAVRTALESSADGQDNATSHDALAATQPFTDEQGNDGTKETTLD